MKKILFFTISFLFSITVFSQTQTREKRTIQVIEPIESYINSATNIGGKTRLYYKINLPTNTIEWYYIFTTNPNTKGSNLKLLQQVTSLVTVNPIASIMVAALAVDTGVHPIDVFLLNDKGFEEFNKKDFFGGYENTRPSHFPEGSLLNSKEGKVKINNLNKGSFYLGLRNPSISTGVNVKLEVVAVVEEIITDNSKWSKQTKELLYDKLITDLKKSNLSDDKIQSFANCMMSRITKNHTPKEFSELANYEVAEILKKYNTECGL